jgi:hypothetical protein
MRNLEASGLINNPKLSVIKAGDATAATTNAAPSRTTSAEDRALPFGFEMTVSLRSANAEAEAEEAAPAGPVPSNVPSPAPAAKAS